LKALFRWKTGGVPEYGDGEVEIKELGLEVAPPASLAIKLRKGYGAKTLAKQFALTALFGPAGAAAGGLVRGAKFLIPFSSIAQVTMTKHRFGIFGDKDFIELKVRDEKKGFELCFAPYEGTVRRKFRTAEFYEALVRKLNLVSASSVQFNPASEEERELQARYVEEESSMNSSPEGRKAVHRGRRRKGSSESERGEYLSEEAEIKFCPMCGSRVRPDYVFCPNCGYRLRK